jgi:Tfp pilus assembly protein PilN
MAAMIHVNLIPVRDIRRAGRRRLRCFWGTAVISLTVIALVALTWREWTTESELTAQLERLDRTIAAGKSDTTTAERMQKELDTHGQKLAILEKIGQPGAAHEDVLRSMATAIPSPLWLTRFALINDTLTLEGRATNAGMITQFLRELESRSRFADNELVEVHQPKEHPDHATTRFSVRSRIVNDASKKPQDKPKAPATTK